MDIDLGRLVHKLSSEVGRSVRAGTARFSSEEVTFGAVSGQIWMEKGGTQAFIDPLDGGGFRIQALVTVWVESNGLAPEEAREEASDIMDREMWPRLSRLGYQPDGDGDEWQADGSGVTRGGVLKVDSEDALFARLRELAATSLNDTFTVSGPVR